MVTLPPKPPSVPLPVPPKPSNGNGGVVPPWLQVPR